MDTKGNYFSSNDRMRTLRISLHSLWLFSSLDDLDRKSKY